mmetsp:Transcript_4513/g.10560  ORF Transcript_4513/g.10560 Transcript_4513/m.10560 type:complete len:211 (-) Transcript_4513:144-776(-)
MWADPSDISFATGAQAREDLNRLADDGPKRPARADYDRVAAAVARARTGASSSALSSSRQNEQQRQEFRPATAGNGNWWEKLGAQKSNRERPVNVVGVGEARGTSPRVQMEALTRTQRLKNRERIEMERQAAQNIPQAERVVYEPKRYVTPFFGPGSEDGRVEYVPKTTTEGRIRPSDVRRPKSAGGSSAGVSTRRNFCFEQPGAQLGYK